MFNTAFCSNSKTIKTATNSSRINTNFKKIKCCNNGGGIMNKTSFKHNINV